MVVLFIAVHFQYHIKISICISCRALCVQIGDKTNVYSLEVSMNGREVPASPEQLKLLPDDKFTVEPYTVEDCEKKTPANFKKNLQDECSAEQLVFFI